MPVRPDTEETEEIFRFSLPDEATADEKEAHALDAKKIIEAIRLKKEIDISNAVIHGDLAKLPYLAEKSISIKNSLFKGAVDCSYTTFRRGFGLEKCTFEADVKFRSTSFDSFFHLYECIFQALFDCNYMVVNGVFNAERSSFMGASLLNSALFRNNAFLVDTTWGKENEAEGALLDCIGLTVNGSLELTGAVLHQSVTFNSASVAGNAAFSGIVFHKGADFNLCKFGKTVNFRATKFKGKAVFSDVSIGSNAFFDSQGGSTEFESTATFLKAKIDGNAWFTKAVFRGAVTFRSAAIGGDADFRKTVYHDQADFSSILIAGHTFFHSTEAVSEGSVFLKEARFPYAVFLKTVQFTNTRFSQLADFSNATFGSNMFFEPLLSDMVFEGEATFARAKVAGAAHFRGTIFRKKANFNSACFEDSAFFNNVQIKDEWGRFEGPADFAHCIFEKNAEFNDTQFMQRANFNGCRFGNVFFEPASHTMIFKGDVVFIRAIITGNAHFRGTVFEGIASFNSSRIEGNALFCKSEKTGHVPEFRDDADFIGAVILGAAAFNNAIFRARALFEEVQFKGDTRFYGTLFSGDVFLGNASLRTLSLQYQPDDDSKAIFASGIQIQMKGCTYERLQPPAFWKEIVDHFDQTDYDRQPFTQMENIFRKSGDETIANEVYFRRRKIEMKRKSLLANPVDLPLDWLHLAVTGFGVKLLRLVIILLVLLAGATVIFHLPQALTPKPEAKEVIVGWSEAFWAALNNFLPVSIPSGVNWNPSYKPLFLNLNFSDFAAFLKVCGWIIVPMLLADLSRKFFKQK